MTEYTAKKVEKPVESLDAASLLVKRLRLDYQAQERLMTLLRQPRKWWREFVRWAKTVGLQVSQLEVASHTHNPVTVKAEHEAKVKSQVIRSAAFRKALGETVDFATLGLSKSDVSLVNALAHNLLAGRAKKAAVAANNLSNEPLAPAPEQKPVLRFTPFN